MRVIGIDPGIANTGWAIIELVKPSKYKHIESGFITTASKDGLSNRIGKIMETIRPLMNGPDSYIDQSDQIKAIGIEMVFFGNNKTSAMSTANVIGAISLSAYDTKIECVHIRPNAVKEAVTGHSKGIDKGFVRHYVNKILDTDFKNDHQIDACAVAIGTIQTIKARGSEWDQIMGKQHSKSKAWEKRGRSKPNHLRRPNLK